MSPVYADRPFSLLESPLYRAQKEDPNIKAPPHIQPPDESHFCAYIKVWCLTVLTHHHEEEAYLFPWVEKLTGVKGLMVGNLEQHKTFHRGLEVFDQYVDDVGGGVVELIDDFGQVLTEHLGDEIPTLMALREFGGFEEIGKQAMGSITMGQLSVMFSNIDLEYEGGLWAHWPAAPGIVKLIIRWIVFPLNGNLAKFGACDRSGRLKPLYAVPAEESK
ncbi:hemerythrin HHE cation binding domain containing protein [Rhypophila decipiens]